MIFATFALFNWSSWKTACIMAPALGRMVHLPRQRRQRGKGTAKQSRVISAKLSLVHSMSALWLFNNMLNAYMFAMHGGWHFVSTLVKTWQEKLTVGTQRALRLRAISRSCGEWGPEGHTWPRCACLEIFKGFSRTTKHPNIAVIYWK